MTAEVNRTGDALLGAGLAGQLNDSNSYGESLLRGAVYLRGVLLLPWQLSLAARAELVATRYADAVQVGRDPAGAFLSIEEEGRTHPAPGADAPARRPRRGRPALQLLDHRPRHRDRSATSATTCWPSWPSRWAGN